MTEEQFEEAIRDRRNEMRYERGARPLPARSMSEIEVDSMIAKDIAENTVTLEDEEAHAFAEYRTAARDLAAATSAMKAAQLRFSAALQKLTAIVAPIEETK